MERHNISLKEYTCMQKIIYESMPQVNPIRNWTTVKEKHSCQAPTQINKQKKLTHYCHRKGNRKNAMKSIEVSEVKPMKQPQQC